MLPLFRTDDETHIVLAPDQDGRQLAAVFTARDAANCYIQAARLQDPELTITLDELDGSRLISNLLALHSDGALDGVVFNCFGPTNPVAFPMTLLEHLFNSYKKEQGLSEGDWL